MSPYTWAALVLFLLGGQAAFVALFMGRDRLIDDWKRAVAEAENRSDVCESEKP